MIAVGVDTHKGSHYAVALDQLGQLLGELAFTASAAGYAKLLRWTTRLPATEEIVYGVEGVGSWGAGVCEYLQGVGERVVEVERPRRRDRRTGKSDRIDALAAAKSVLAGEHLSIPRGRGVLSVIRALLIARRSAVGERTRVLNQLQALHATAPIALRERVGHGTGKQLERRVTAMRLPGSTDPQTRAIFGVLRDLAARSRALGHDATRYERELATHVRSLDTTLLDEPGIGPISAAKLLACDPTRFTHEAAFARCNGTAPLPASSGMTIRHRLNRGGDRQANNAIHTIAIIRAKHQPETRAYLDRRISEGKTKREALRALKRHISRDLYKRLTDLPLTS